MQIRAVVLGIIACCLLFGPVRAADHTAGLIVFKGDGTSIWVTVPFAEDEISGADLIERSGLAVTEVSFGGLGIGVCGIEETGCDVAECRKRLCQGPSRDDPYWQYFIGGTDGAWLTAPLGISADKVHDGDVRAFIWSAEPPDVAAPLIADVIAKVGSTDGVMRFDAEGNVAGVAAADASDIPWIGIGVVGVGVFAVGGLVVRRRIGAVAA